MTGFPARNCQHVQPEQKWHLRRACRRLPLLQHGLLRAQVGHLLPQQANLSLVVVDSVQLPLVTVQLLVR